MADFTRTMVPTSRLTQSVWTSGPDDGVPLLLVHGNLVSGGWWRYVAEALPDEVRVIAPDLRGFGRTEPSPVDATRGLGEMADDLHALLETLGLAGTGRVNAAGWSMGGGVLMQYLLDHPGEFVSEDRTHARVGDEAVVQMQVRTADAAARHAHDGIARMFDDGIRHLLRTYPVWASIGSR